MITGVGTPCGWVISKCGCGSCWAGYSPEVQQRAQTIAAGVMWAATGRQYGPCPVMVMPCNPPPQEPLYQTFPAALRGYYPGGAAGLMQPVLENGQWFNRCGPACACTAPCEVSLDGPVHSVVAVTVDGAPITPTAYEVHDQRLLVRLDGDCWPVCAKYGTEIPGFTVTYLRGLDIPAQVQAGFELLACQMAKACTGGECGLPPRVTNLTRQGVSVAFEDITQLLNTGGGRIRTGIKTVDDIITANNPYGQAEPRRVISPDLPAARSITWQPGS